MPSNVRRLSNIKLNCPSHRLPFRCYLQVCLTVDIGIRINKALHDHEMIKDKSFNPPDRCLLMRDRPATCHCGTSSYLVQTSHVGHLPLSMDVEETSVLLAAQRAPPPSLRARLRRRHAGTIILPVGRSGNPELYAMSRRTRSVRGSQGEQRITAFARPWRRQSRNGCVICTDLRETEGESMMSIARSMHHMLDSLATVLRQRGQSRCASSHRPMHALWYQCVQ